MKTLPTIAAVTIAMALLLVPLASSAAGTLTISSPAAGASFKGSQAYTISGAISPIPTQADNVGIVVANPNGATVDQGNVPVNSGAFSYSTAVGGTAAWVTGTYTITATDTFGATSSATFTYTSSTTSFNETAILIQINSTNAKILANQATILSDLNALTSAVNGVSSAVGTISTNVGTILSDINSLTSTVGQINTNVGTLSSQLPSAGTISNTQTYVLVVAVLAAITLVLELAILVRKIS